MFDVITVHYGEVGLKRGRRGYFEGVLMDNLRRSLGGLSYRRVRRVLGRILVEVDGGDVELYRGVVSRVFGVRWFAFARSVVPRDFDRLVDVVVDELRSLSFSTFKVDATRADKSFPYTSMDVNRMVGSVISERLGGRVSMESPDVTVYIEILGDRFLVYFRRFEGPGGLPVGTGGRVLHLFSGGIDSPVAAWLLMKRGVFVDYVHFYAVKDVDEARASKVGELVRFLTYFSYRSRVFYVPFHIFHLVAAARLDPRMETVVFRRFMMRVAEFLARKYGYDAISTGESLAQVASQTMQNMISISYGLGFQVLRPLLTYDKEEIISLAKRIGTYELSLKECKDACSIISLHPRTNVKPEEVLKAEAEIDIDRLIEKTLSETVVVEYKLSHGEIKEQKKDYKLFHS